MPDSAGKPQNTSGAGRATLWLRRGDQCFVGVLLVVGLVLMLVHWWRLSDGNRHPIEIERLPAGQYEYRVDINQATWVEWAQFDGIGESLARRIVADRDQRGPFASVDDVLRVPGIGAKKLEGMRQYLVVDPP